MLRGQQLGTHYAQINREEERGILPGTNRRLLIQLLDHCRKSVPYYSKIMKEMGGSYREDPEEYLRAFPILTKDIIRVHFDELKSTDLAKRKWYFNTSGGATGEPVRFIQDRDYAARAGAISLLFSKVAADKEIGESEIMLWGSERDITGTMDGVQSRFATSLTHTKILSVFRLEPEISRRYIELLNKERPKLIVGYASALYEIAKCAEQNDLQIVPQRAIITSAATLYPHMRETIERVFHCRVFDRYGSREVGGIACERSGTEGLWVAPWGNYLEIVDRSNNRVADGVKGEIIITSLSNYAMPLIRYRIGDQGALSQSNNGSCQILAGILGRSYDTFVNSRGILIEGGYFMALLYYRDWIAKYQVIQKSPDCILFRIVTTGTTSLSTELDDLTIKSRRIMGDDTCKILFEFVDEIPTSSSGKYHFIASEVPR
jgi:phenylacetate-CoA ligase